MNLLSSNLISFLNYLLRGFKWGLILLILSGVAGIFLGLGFIYFSKEVIDMATGIKQGDIFFAVGAMAMSLLGSALLRLVNISLSNKTAVRMGNAIRERIFGHLLYTRWQSLKKIHSGDMLTRIIRDTDEVVTLLTNSLPTLILSALQLFSALLMMYCYSSTLALMLGVGMPLTLVVGRLFYRKMLGFSSELKTLESQLNSHIQESLGNQTVIRTFERQEAELSKLEMIQAQLYQTSRKRVSLTMYSTMMSSAAFSGGYLVAFLWSAYGLLHGFIQFGTVTAFLQLITRIQRPLLDLLSLVPSLISAKASLDRLVSVLECQTETFRHRELITTALTLEVQGLHFAYEDGEEFLFEDFNLNVSSGSMVAVMGETGSGKTTFLRLLLGLVAPTKGKLQLRSRERCIPISEGTRSNFVYVPQGNTLLSGTIRENLLVGDPTADDARLREVLSIAVADFVYSLPEGLDTQLGERGQGLSEGQAQRLAIARSLLRPGRILLLDEATSALDSETERHFLKNLRQNIGERIVLFITHHREVSEICDKVVHL